MCPSPLAGAIVTGAGVGGGSLVSANVQLRAPDEIFDDR